jgi:hypothetical protein
VVDCSYWHWAEREDEPPPGLLEAAEKDIDGLFERLETMLLSRPKPWPLVGEIDAGRAVFPG